MKRELLVAVGGVAIVVAGLSGCSSNDNKDASDQTTAATVTTGESPATATTGDATAARDSGTARVSIDGKDHPVQGTVVCATVAGNVSVTVGQGLSGISATLTDGDQPSVTALALGNIDGVSLGYTPGVPGGDAQVTKTGKTYLIKGNATGVDGMNPVTKPFEVEVSCP